MLLKVTDVLLQKLDLAKKFHLDPLSHFSYSDLVLETYKNLPVRGILGSVVSNNSKR